MRKGLLCYTTQIEPAKTIAEIQMILAKHGAKSVLTNYDDNGKIESLSFSIMTPEKEIGIKLPCDPKPVQKVLRSQYEAGKIPRRYAEDEHQALRVSWRIVLNWVEAQMAILETKMVKMEQIFLPYAIMQDGRTLFENMKKKAFKLLGANIKTNNKKLTDGDLEKREEQVNLETRIEEGEVE